VLKWIFLMFILFKQYWYNSYEILFMYIKILFIRIDIMITITTDRHCEDYDYWL